MKFWMLLILLIGCGGTIQKMAPIFSPPPFIITNISQKLPNQPIIKTPIREMDLLHQKIQDYTVGLVQIKKDEKETSATSYCTGVWVSLDEILTAAHCVKDSETGKVPIGDIINYVVRSDIDYDGYSYYHLGKVTVFDDAVDLVLIQVDFEKMPSHRYVSLPFELPAIGERVYGVGHPNKNYWSFAEGEVSAYRRISEIGDVIQANLSTWYGNSGGGLFDRDGKLIGICSRKLEVPSMGFYVHLDNINKFLDEAKIIRLGKEIK
jgi:S1-C subfamily serine protease